MSKITIATVSDIILYFYLAAMIIAFIAWLMMRRLKIEGSKYFNLVEQLLLLWFIFEATLFVVCKMGNPRKVADVIANFGYDFSVLLLALFLYVPKWFQQIWKLPLLLFGLMGSAYVFDWQMSYATALVFFQLAIILLSVQMVKLAMQRNFEMRDFIFLVFIILDDMCDMAISYLVHYTDWTKHESLVRLMSIAHLGICILFLGYYVRQVLEHVLRHYSLRSSSKKGFLKEINS